MGPNHTMDCHCTKAGEYGNEFCAPGVVRKTNPAFLFRKVPPLGSRQATILMDEGIA